MKYVTSYDLWQVKINIYITPIESAMLDFPAL